jgi:replicative DNA helicase
MLVCSQLNRECEGRKDKRPELADLRASGTIEQDADLVFLLFRPGYYDEDAAAGGQTELLVAKHRNGPTGVRRLVWDGTRTAFYDPHPVPAPDRAEGWS